MVGSRDMWRSQLRAWEKETLVPVSFGDRKAIVLRVSPADQCYHLYFCDFIGSFIFSCLCSE